MAEIEHRHEQLEEQSDEQRFIEIIRAHRSGLLAYASGLVDGNPGRAEDVVQETFLRAWRRIDQLTSNQLMVKGWLRRVAYNIVIDRHRMILARPAEVELEHPDIASSDDRADEVLRGILIQQMLSSIWPEHRAVLVELYLNDRTLAQTAALLNIPVGTVKSRHHNALRALRGTRRTASLLAS